jgi:hypothetical protein
MIPVIIRSKIIEKFFSIKPLGLCKKIDPLFGIDIINLRCNHLPIIPMYVFGVSILKIGVLSDRVIIDLGGCARFQIPYNKVKLLEVRI